MTRRRRWQAAALVALVALSYDVTRDPDRQWSARFLLWGIHTYQATMSPMMPAMGVQCRFTPTCSHYGEASIRDYGAFWGSLRTAWRILRCGPWTKRGTHDPP